MAFLAISIEIIFQVNNIFKHSIKGKVFGDCLIYLNVAIISNIKFVDIFRSHSKRVKH